jgi:hypothetical protein
MTFFHEYYEFVALIHHDSQNPQVLNTADTMPN